jgi:hypothetical protein
MAGFSRRLRRIVNVVAAVLFLAGSLFLVDRFVIALPVALTPERARAALAERFPELRDAPIALRDGNLWIGECHCDLRERRWSYSFRSTRYFAEHPSGRFEHSLLGRWSAVETERWLQPAPGSIKVP